MNGKIIDYSYGVWENDYKLAIVVKGQESLIQFFNLRGESVDPLVLGNSKITDLEVIDNFIHVVDDQETIIGLDFTDEIGWEFLLTEDYVKEWFVVEWRVLKIRTSKEFPNLLVVKLPTELVLVDTQKRPVLLSKLSLETEDFDFTFSPKSLIIFSWNSSDPQQPHSIQEYTLTDLTLLYPLKTFESYDY